MSIFGSPESLQQIRDLAPAYYAWKSRLIILYKEISDLSIEAQSISIFIHNFEEAKKRFE